MKMAKTVLLSGALLGVLLLSSCRIGGTDFRHDRHAGAAKGACAPCHGGDGKGPRKASAADCAPCHDEAKDASLVKRFAEGAPSTRKARTYDDVIFSHAPHGSAGVKCAACHGEGRDPFFPSMEECSGCHRKEGAPLSCESCHRKLRKDARPPSHQADWEVRHGEASRSMRETCAICHEERSCAACHATRRPSSHVGGWDKSGHGLAAAEERAPCATCHEASYCSRCHSVPPPSHYRGNFRFGGHKPYAASNPRSCAVCHERAFCRSCHTGG